MKAKIRGHNLPTERQSDLEKAAGRNPILFLRRVDAPDEPWYLYHHPGRSGVRREKEKARIRWNGYEPREMKSTISIANNT